MSSSLVGTRLSLDHSRPELAGLLTGSSSVHLRLLLLRGGMRVSDSAVVL